MMWIFDKGKGLGRLLRRGKGLEPHLPYMKRRKRLKWK